MVLEDEGNAAVSGQQAIQELLGTSHKVTPQNKCLSTNDIMLRIGHTSCFHMLKK